MEVIYLDHTSKQINKEPHVMAIGFFDGVHLGHQELLDCAKSLAEKQNTLFTALTFSPHPDEVIKGKTDKKYITPLDQKIKKMAALGVDKLFVMKFDKNFASLAPADFINQYITGTNARHVVVGFDFTFGFKAQGDAKVLRRASKQQQFGLSVIPKKTYLDEKISSTLLREVIEAGDVDMVPYYLGSHYRVKMKAVAQVGPERLKIQLIDRNVLPIPGIYHVEISDGMKTVHGEFLRYSYSEADNEIAVGEQLNYQNENLSVVFLNKISETSVIPV